MKKLLLSLLSICMAFGLWGNPNKYNIIPQPNSIIAKEGVCKIKDINIVCDKTLTNEAELLKQYLNDDFGLSAKINDSKVKQTIVLKHNIASAMPAEAYTLEVNSNCVTISASAASGVFYGIQTLRQLIKKEVAGIEIPNVLINDYPQFAWRSFMLDEGRYFKGKKVVIDILNEMSLLKMNTFHWHLTDDQGWRIEIKKYPKLTEVGAFRDSTEINHFHSEIYDGKPHGGFYTQDDIKEIVAYAARLHITIVPEIEMPGHASAAIAAYPWLGVTKQQIKVPCRFGVQYDVFDVTDPKVIQFFSDVFDEIITLFPSKVVHIGGDEIRYNQWKDSEKVQQYMTEHKIETPAELQVYFTSNIAETLKTKNKQMMGWNEITGEKLHDYQAATDTKEVRYKLPKEVIVAFWKGEIDIIRRTTEAGNRVVNVHHLETYLDYSYKSISLEKAYHFSPIPKGLATELHSKILGSSCQMWGEFIPTVESMNKKIYPRIAAFAEGGWTKPENKEYDRFITSMQYFFSRWQSKGIGYEQNYNQK